MKKSILFLLVILVAGCDALGRTSGDDGIPYDFETEHSRFTVTDSIEAAFVNRSAQTIYVFQGCPTVGIERRAASSWQPIEIPIFCTQNVKIPLAVEPGERFHAKLPPWMLAEAAIKPGTYRLGLTVGWSRERVAQQATSNPFEILDSD